MLFALGLLPARHGSAALERAAPARAARPPGAVSQLERPVAQQRSFKDSRSFVLARKRSALRRPHALAGQLKSRCLVQATSSVDRVASSVDPVQSALDDIRRILVDASISEDQKELEAQSLSPPALATLLGTGVAELAPGGKLKPTGNRTLRAMLEVIERLATASPPPSAMGQKFSPPPADDRDAYEETGAEPSEPEGVNDTDLFSDLGRARAFVLAAIKHYGGSAKSFPTHRFVEHSFSQGDWDRVVKVLRQIKSVRTKAKRGSKATISITSSCGGTLLGLLRRIEHLLSQPRGVGKDMLTKVAEPKTPILEDAALSVVLPPSVLSAGISAEDIVFARDAIAQAVIVSGADAQAVPLRTAGLKQRDITRMSRTLMRLNLVEKNKEKNGIFVSPLLGGTLARLLEILDGLLDGKDLLPRDDPEEDADEDAGSAADDESDEEDEEEPAPVLLSPEDEKHAVFRALAFIESAMGIHGPSSAVLPEKKMMPESFAAMYDNNVDFLSSVGMVDWGDDVIEISPELGNLGAVAETLERLINIMEGEDAAAESAALPVDARRPSAEGEAQEEEQEEEAQEEEQEGEAEPMVDKEDVRKTIRIVEGAIKRAGADCPSFPASWHKRKSKNYESATQNLIEWGLIEAGPGGSFEILQVSNLSELLQVLRELESTLEEPEKVEDGKQLADVMRHAKMHVGGYRSTEEEIEELRRVLEHATARLAELEGKPSRNGRRPE